MNCAEAGRALLQADSTALKGRGDSPLAAHLGDCEACASLAGVILEGEASIAHALQKAAPALDPSAILKAARERGPLRSSDPRFRLPHWVRSRGLSLLPLAAAAAVATLLLSGEPSLPGPPYRPPAEPAGLEVEPPAGQNIVVLQTGDPDITILWLF